MSWIDRLQSDLIITTGDGRVYRPLWMPGTKVTEYNIAKFEFPEISGTLIKKTKPKGRVFDLEIYFQGDDCLETSEAFEISANDERAWSVSHPQWGLISCHAASLVFDNKQYNCVKVTGQLLETITEDNPKTVINPIDNISIAVEVLGGSFVNAFDATPEAADINTMTARNNKFYNLGSKIISLIEESESYFNLINVANSAILNATSLPLLAIRATQSFIMAPALFTTSVKSRTNLLSSQFASLRSNLSFITKRPDKKIYENTGGTLIAAHALAVANPQEGDYGNARRVLNIIEPLINDYNNYLSDLDVLQTENGGDPESFIPDAGALAALNNLVSLTVSGLYKIALNSKKERSIILEEDSNWILLTHRFYGLDALDNNINELIENNEAGLNEMLQVRKGRKIIYYI